MTHASRLPALPAPGDPPDLPLPDCRLLKGDFNIHVTRAVPKAEKYASRTSMLAYTARMRALNAKRCSLSVTTASTNDNDLGQLQVHARPMQHKSRAPPPRLPPAQGREPRLPTRRHTAPDSQQETEQQQPRLSLASASDLYDILGQQQRRQQRQQRGSLLPRPIALPGIDGGAWMDNQPGVSTAAPDVEEMEMEEEREEQEDDNEPERRMVYHATVPGRRGLGINGERRLALQVDREQGIVTTKDMLRRAIAKLKDMEQRRKDPLARLPRIKRSKRIRFDTCNLSAIPEGDSEEEEEDSDVVETPLSLLAVGRRNASSVTSTITPLRTEPEAEDVTAGTVALLPPIGGGSGSGGGGGGQIYYPRAGVVGASIGGRTGAAKTIQQRARHRHKTKKIKFLKEVK